MKKIKKISFLSASERIYKESNQDGCFYIFETREGLSGAVTTRSKKTAMELVTDKNIKHMDPTLTFDDGYKLRVYQSGDPSFMLAEATSLIEIHDAYYSFIGDEDTFFDDDDDDHDYYMKNNLFSYNFNMPHNMSSFKPNFKFKPKATKIKMKKP